MRTSVPGQILILQNGDDCPPGLLGEQILAAGIQCDLRELFAGDPLPADSAQYSGIVTLGGSMSALDDARHPYVEGQIRLLREGVAAGKPVMGICLGSQILARAMGSRVYESLVPEYFFTALEPMPAAADCVLGPPREWPAVVSWHFDMSDLPPAAQLLARSEGCAVQAYRLGAGQYGLQFHPEATRRLIELWIERFELEFGADERMDRVRREVEGCLPAAQRFGRDLFQRWLSIVGAQR